MKVLVLCSGGDAPGMNRVVYSLSKYLKLDYARAGYKGLVEGDIFPLDFKAVKESKDEAGAVIYSSRYPKFKEEKYFKKGLKNALNYDYVIIIGGNGSQRGAKELAEAGANMLFIPGSIDNDVINSSYSLGFQSAVDQCVYTIQNCMPSINAFCYTCFFEVMGRDSGRIAEETYKNANADVLVAKMEDFKVNTIAKKVKENVNNGKGTCIVLKEKMRDRTYFVEALEERVEKGTVKYQVVGRTQRGGKPAKMDLVMADKFASAAAKEIKLGHKNKSILVDEKMNIKICDLL